ncbi:MAG: WlaTC/HtrL family glycosyltransferase [Vicinamibacterales bacterium]
MGRAGDRRARSCPSDRPILTTSATPFDPEHEDAREHVPMQMNFDRFTSEGIILFRPGELRDWQRLSRPARARFLSAHFLFAPGRFVEDVPYDPDLYFTGEEITLAVRAFTHGYDLFHPRHVIVWHEYTRAYRPHKHWTDHDGGPEVEMAWHARDRASLDKVAAFLAQPEPGRLGLGVARTFDEYEAYAGVSISRRRAQEYTRAGFEPPNPPADEGWADRIRGYALDLAIEKRRLPADVHDYHFWYVGVHDAHGLEIVRQDVDREGVRALLADAGAHAVIRCAFETDRTPASWTVWPVSDTRGWLERIDGPVLPLHPPVTLVTALVDLGREALGGGFGRSFEAHYLPLFEQLLETPLPMVVYAEPRLEALVWRHRHPSNTRLELVRPEDLEAGDGFADIQRIRADANWLAQAGWLADSPQAALAHYNALVFSKMRWLAEAARANAFGASHLFWVDAGLVHTVPGAVFEAPALAGRLADAAGPFLWVEYPYPDGDEIHGFPRPALAALAGVSMVDRVVRGGFFGGRVEEIPAVEAQFEALRRDTLARGLMGTEESLFTVLAYREPSRYAHYLVERDGLLGPFFQDLLAGRAAGRRQAPERRAVEVVPFPVRTAQADPIEVPDDVERGHTTFFGLPMMQNRHAILAIDRLLRTLEDEGRRVARIVELGTGVGGLTVLFHLYARVTGARFVTVDRSVHDTAARALFEPLDVDARRRDVAEPFAAAEIAREIQGPGITLLVCDGPDKLGDVTRLAPYLKTGDLVMAHDYAASTDTFEQTMRGRLWNWCEITDRDFEAVGREHELDRWPRTCFRAGGMDVPGEARHAGDAGPGRRGGLRTSRGVNPRRRAGAARAMVRARRPSSPRSSQAARRILLDSSTDESAHGQPRAGGALQVRA